MGLTQRRRDRRGKLSACSAALRETSGVDMDLDIAIVEGARTPFVKAFGLLADVKADELGRTATEGVLARTNLKPDQIDQVVYGNVVLPADAANIARVIALKAGIPQDRIAHTVQRNC